MAWHSDRFRTTLVCLACAAGAFWGSTVAQAAVVQPDGLAVPIREEDSKDYFDARYRPATLGLQSMLIAWEGAINNDVRTPVVDAYQDGSSTNVVFSPLCGLTGSMILRGGSCQVDFGWYCIDDPVGQEKIHPLVTKADILNYHDSTLLTMPGTPPLPPPDTWKGLQNDDKGFVPTIQSGIVKAVKGSAELGNVRASAAFQACASGKIGFAFVGNPSTICPMSKFSEPKRNQTSNFNGQPWVSAIVYQSKKTPGAFYIAFEDMPTSPASFRPALGTLKSTFPQMTNSTSGWEDWQNDGDFNDIVYKVEGILCQGGGQPCTPRNSDGTAMLGNCSIGTTTCSADPNISETCQQRIQPTAETCNALDDDCDGVADNGDGLCPDGYVCSNGNCVGSCGSLKFPCTNANTVCQRTGRLAGFCVEAACQNVECPPGQRCVGGNCVNGCGTCLPGTECIAGSCIDLCAGVKCDGDFVCERGTCIPSCKCLPCTDPSRSYCNTNGRCVDERCKDTTCEQYKTCVAGACVDPCAGEPCGLGIECTPTSDGKASCPNGSAPAAGGTSSITIVPSATGSNGAKGKGRATGPATSGSDPSGGGCRIAGAESKRGLAMLALLGLATSALGLRRRSRQER
jgi:hypothetical protein